MESDHETRLEKPEAAAVCILNCASNFCVASVIPHGWRGWTSPCSLKPLNASLATPTAVPRNFPASSCSISRSASRFAKSLVFISLAFSFVLALDVRYTLSRVLIGKGILAERDPFGFIGIKLHFAPRDFRFPQFAIDSFLH